MTIENSPLPMPSGSITERNAVSSAMPVTMPGSAIGNTITKDNAWRPKNR